jgi:hypothetical protein
MRLLALNIEGCRAVTFDTTINLPTMVTGLLALITLVIWLVKLGAKTETNGRDIDTLSKTLYALEALVELRQTQFQEYRIQAAKDYMTQASVSEIKRDLIDEMGKMERRVEQTINRALSAARDQ